MNRFCLYRLTVSNVRYDSSASRMREDEIHFRVARKGSLRRNRRILGRRALRYFQWYIFKRYGKFIPLAKIRVHFEREEPAKQAQTKIAAEIRMMEQEDGRWQAHQQPSRIIPLRATKIEREILKLLEGGSKAAARAEKKHKKIMEEWMRMLRDAKKRKSS